MVCTEKFHHSRASPSILGFLIFTCKAYVRRWSGLKSPVVTFRLLPTERNIMVLIGDSGSGKGTHLGAIEAMLTMDDLVLFAKAGPHKLADQREHFSKQNLQNKLALLKGDLSHSTIHDFSEVNDIFGGEPTEMEQKFKDPTMERQTFKGIWASAPPLFKITQAGGAWRRINLIALKPPFEKDNSTKPKLLRKIDGFFLNGLLGLSYLISNNWQFTGELENDEIEKLWSFHSDSIQVWAQKLVPESEENEDTMIVIDEFSKFGVEQRQNILKKGAKHLLLMR